MGNKINSINILTIFFSLIFIFSGCEPKENFLSFDIKNVPDSLSIYLLNDGTTVDSVLLIKGQGELKNNIKNSKEVYISNFDRTNKTYTSVKGFRYKFFWIEPANIKITGNYNSFRDLKISGSKSEDISNEFELIENKFSQTKDSLKQLISKTKDENLKADLNKLKELNFKIFVSDMSTKMLEHRTSYVALHRLSWECIYARMPKPDISKILNLLPDHFKNSELGLNILDYTKLPKVPEIGEKAINFTMTTISGDSVSLSEYSGKITLVQFWNGGCGACREEIPIIAEIYKKYNPRGLEILGVSGAKAKEELKEDLTLTEIPWKNITDYKGHFNKAFLLYDINGIPNNFLIDENGIITHKDLRGDKLNQVLSEIFNR